MPNPWTSARRPSTWSKTAPGSARPISPEGCVGSYAEQSAAVVEGGCEGLSEEKSDLFCSAALSWLDLCGQEPLAKVARIDTVSDVCPSSRSDALCEALRTADDLAFDASKGGDRETARDAFEEALEQARVSMLENPNAARQDAAYRYLVRIYPARILSFTRCSSAPA